MRTGVDVNKPLSLENAVVVCDDQDNGEEGEVSLVKGATTLL